MMMVVVVVVAVVVVMMMMMTDFGDDGGGGDDDGGCDGGDDGDGDGRGSRWRPARTAHPRFLSSREVFYLMERGGRAAGFLSSRDGRAQPSK